MSVIFSSKNVNQSHKLELAYSYACWIIHARCHLQNNMKMERWRWPEMLLILGRSGTQYVAMVTKFLSSYCAAPLVEPYCKKSNISVTNWLRYRFYHIWSKFGWVYDVITWLICIFWNLEYLWNEKRYLKKVNGIFLLIKSTCLCFKMASIGKMRFSS